MSVTLELPEVGNSLILQGEFFDGTRLDSETAARLVYLIRTRQWY